MITIRRKLSLGFGLVIVTMLGLGCLSAVGLYSITNMGMKIHDQAFMVGTFSQSATARFFKIKALFESARVLDEEARDEVRETIEVEQVRFIEDLEVVQTRSLDTRVDERVPSLIEDFNVWIEEKTEFLEKLSETSHAAEPKSLQNRTKSLEVILRFLTRVSTESGFVVRLETEEQGQSLLYLTIVLTLCGFLIAVGVAWLTSRPIVRRLSQLDEHLQLAVQGNFSGRTDFSQKNELFDTASQAVGEVCQTAEQVSAEAMRISDGHSVRSQPTTAQASSVGTTAEPMDNVPLKDR